MRAHLLPALATVLFVALDASAATPPEARYTRVDHLAADMEHVATKAEEGAYLRLVVGGQDGIYHVCVVSNDAMKAVRMTGQYLDSALTVAHGEFNFYHANGRRESTGAYANGVKTGRWMRWSVNGVPLATKEYLGLAGDALNEHLGLSSVAPTAAPRARMMSQMNF